MAKFVDLTPQKVNEKRTIVEAAKTAGVDIEECRTIDPDNASVELFARLRKAGEKRVHSKNIFQKTLKSRRRNLTPLSPSRKVFLKEKFSAETVRSTAAVIFV